jgi:hypothetical protein
MHRMSAHAAVLTVSSRYPVADNLHHFRKRICQVDSIKVAGQTHSWNKQLIRRGDGDAMDDNQIKQGSHKL